MVAEPVEAARSSELPLPAVSEMTLLPMGWGATPCTLSVTVTVVLPPWDTAVLRAVMDELDGVTTGAAKVTRRSGSTITEGASPVSVAVYVTGSAAVSLTVKTACPLPSVVAVDPGAPLTRRWNGPSLGTA